jgi:hypothetical protein
MEKGPYGLQNIVGGMVVIGRLFVSGQAAPKTIELVLIGAEENHLPSLAQDPANLLQGDL